MKILLQLSALLFLVFAGCHGFGINCHGIGVRGSGVTKEETRKLEDFNAIDAGGAYNIEIVCGKSPEVTIYGEDNILPLIRTEVRDQTLHIYNRKSISPRRKIRIQISTNNIEKINASGASDISISNINNDRFDVDASGAGKMNISGKTNYIALSLSGAVKVNARDLISDNANVEISGASKAEVYASKELRAEISGVGSLDYYGNPEKVKRNISGVGSINQR